MLKDLIPSKARRKILGLFFTNYGESYHLRKVCREVNIEINAVKRELDILEKAKVLRKEKRMNKSVYSLNTTYVLHDELIRIYAKESPLNRKILKNRTKLGKVQFVALSLKLLKKNISKKAKCIFFLLALLSLQKFKK